MLFSILLMARPEAGALSLLWLIAAYAVMFGIILVILAFRVEGLVDRLKRA